MNQQVFSEAEARKKPEAAYFNSRIVVENQDDESKQQYSEQAMLSPWNAQAHQELTYFANKNHRTM